MSDCVKLTESTARAHTAVCKHKERSPHVCETARNINITLNEHYEDSARTRYIPVDNVDCIGYIEVHCKHYLSASKILSTSRSSYGGQVKESDGWVL